MKGLLRRYDLCERGATRCRNALLLLNGYALPIASASAAASFLADRVMETRPGLDRQKAYEMAYEIFMAEN